MSQQGKEPTCVNVQQAQANPFLYSDIQYLSYHLTKVECRRECRSVFV